MNAVAKSVVVALSLAIAGGLIFGFGMVAGPLTPSEGHPTPLAWVVFLILPLLLCFTGIVLFAVAHVLEHFKVRLGTQVFHFNLK